MANSRHHNFRTFLTERFTAVAVEVFEEVESIVEEYYEENKRLRDMLHMVLNPEIKIQKIDLSRYTGAITHVKEQSPEPDIEVDFLEPLPKKPKEEEIEYDIGSGSEQQGLDEAANLITPDCLKKDAEEEHSIMPRITDSYHISVTEPKPDSSTTASADEAADGHEDCSSLDSNGVTDYPQLSRSEEGTSESQEPQKHNNESEKKKSKRFRQKTMLEMPRMMPYKSFTAAPTDCHSFLARLTEAFKDVPEDKKPLITKMGLAADVELVDSAFGQVPKGCPLSYQCPVPSKGDYKTIDNAPPRPLLPQSKSKLEPILALPDLSPKEQEHVAVMQITWEEAHNLEQSTRKHTELVKELRKLRLTSRFKEICKLKPGKSYVAQLIFKILKGPPRCKSVEVEEEMKTEALRIYCRNLCVNWYHCGFIVHPNAPWLGAHPDGLVYDPNEKHSFGLVHVKCIHFKSFMDCGFLMCKDGRLKVNKTHQHYWHIQGEMMVAGMSWCDLLVISREDILVQRIYRDKVIIKVMEKKLHDFFFSYYLPSLFENDIIS